MKIIPNNNIPTTRYQFRSLISKKKRIRKKWSKDERNWRNKNHTLFNKESGNFYCNKETYEKILKSAAIPKFDDLI